MKTINTHRLIVGLSVFIIFLSIFIIFYPRPRHFVKTTPTPWQTYTNNYLGLSFNFPSDWKITSSDPYIDLDQISNFSISSHSYLDIIYFKVESYSLKSESFKQNAEFWLDYYLSSTAEMGNAVTKNFREESYKINNIQGLKYAFSYQYEHMDQPGTAVWIYLPLQKKELLSIKYYSETSDPQKLQLYNQILSTFHFLNGPSEAPAKEGKFIPSDCKTAGCSSELCIDANSPDIASICLWKEEYSCLKYSVCQEQTNGQCAWAQTPEYQRCISGYRQ